MTKNSGDSVSFNITKTRALIDAYFLVSKQDAKHAEERIRTFAVTENGKIKVPFWVHVSIDPVDEIPSLKSTMFAERDPPDGSLWLYKAEGVKEPMVFLLAAGTWALIARGEDPVHPFLSSQNLRNAPVSDSDASLVLGWSSKGFSVSWEAEKNPWVVLTKMRKGRFLHSGFVSNISFV
jgi:hypothetical protein